MKRRRGMERIAAIALVAAALVGIGAATSGAAPAPKPKRVTVADFYFGPDKVTIRKGGKVKWVWSALNTEPHDVHLKKGPKKLKKRRTYSTQTTAVTGARFTKAFPRPGTYRYICTLHPSEMRMTVVVKN